MLKTWIRLLVPQKHTKALSLLKLQVTVVRESFCFNCTQTNSPIQNSPLFLYIYIYGLKTVHVFDDRHNFKMIKLEIFFAEIDVFNTVIGFRYSLMVLMVNVMW